jgi:hypothetical protein
VLLEHLLRCRFFSSKLKFRFGNDKTFSNGPFPKSKVCYGPKSSPKWRTLGNFLAQTVLWASFWTNSFPAKRAHCRLFPTWYARWRRRGELRRVTNTTTCKPFLARRSKLPPRFPHAVPCALDNFCHVWRAGRLAPQLERAALARGWSGTRRFPLVCIQHRMYSSSVRQTVSFRRWCAACGTAARLGIGENWRGVAASAKVLYVQQISGLFHTMVAVGFAP